MKLFNNRDMLQSQYAFLSDWKFGKDVMVVNTNLLRGIERAKARNTRL